MDRRTILYVEHSRWTSFLRNEGLCLQQHFRTFEKFAFYNRQEITIPLIIESITNVKTFKHWSLCHGAFMSNQLINTKWNRLSILNLMCERSKLIKGKLRFLLSFVYMISDKQSNYLRCLQNLFNWNPRLNFLFLSLWPIYLCSHKIDFISSMRERV